MNLINIILQGNLVKDASFTKFLDKEKGVFNFVIACNLPNDKVFYADCSYWINYKENQENKQKELFANNLKKGINVTVQSEYLESRQSQGQDGTKYNNILFTVNKIFFNSFPRERETTTTAEAVAKAPAEPTQKTIEHQEETQEESQNKKTKKEK